MVKLETGTWSESPSPEVWGKYVTLPNYMQTPKTYSWEIKRRKIKIFPEIPIHLEMSLIFPLFGISSHQILSYLAWNDNSVLSRQGKSVFLKIHTLTTSLCCFTLLYVSLSIGHGKPLQYSCLENPMDGGAWWATVREVSESDMMEGT